MRKNDLILGLSHDYKQFVHYMFTRMKYLTYFPTIFWREIQIGLSAGYAADKRYQPHIWLISAAYPADKRYQPHIRLINDFLKNITRISIISEISLAVIVQITQQSWDKWRLSH